MTEGTTIRPAAEADASALARFAERTFRDTFGAENTPDDMDAYCRESFGEAIQRREILDADSRVLLADADGAIAGFAQLLLQHGFGDLAAEDCAELRRIYIGSRFLGSGIAQRLLTETIDLTKRARLSHLWLGVWEHNPRAIRFYRKAGFETIGEHPFTLGSERQRDIVMALALSN